MSGPAVSHVAARFGDRAAMPAKGFLENTERIQIDALQESYEKAQGLALHLRRSREQVLAIAPKLLEPELAPLLEWILDITLRRPNFLPLGAGAEQIAIHAAYREGANGLAWQLLQAIAEGREEVLPHREGT
jgi:hypothetical protein